jgi:molybdenum cofactor synthesis domain-containing protein
MQNNFGQNNIVTAAFLIIGNEILSGKTQDANLTNLAQNLNKSGVRLMEVRVVLDIKDEIIKATKELSDKYNYLFTSGGIGPTHDDITTESIAECFGVKTEIHPEAYKALNAFYLAKNEIMNEGRKKMAIIPLGASLINNSVSIAPGFRLKNVFVMAGVPKIFSAMLGEALKEINGGAVMLSKSIDINLTEGVIAQRLTQIQNQNPSVEIGSYPKDGYTQIVVAGYNQATIEKVIELVKNL